MDYGTYIRTLPGLIDLRRSQRSLSWCGGQQNMVIVVSGESGRQAFFSAKGLDLTEGFKILSGAVRILVLSYIQC